MEARATRQCLRCQRMFDSAGPWNRLCRRCKTANERLLRSKGRLYDSLPYPTPDGDEDVRFNCRRRKGATGPQEA